MDFLYVLLHGGDDWEDLVLFATEEDAIRESIKKPNTRVEIFSKDIQSNGYVATYNYYQNGKLIQNL